MTEAIGKILRVDGTEEDLMAADLTTMQEAVGGLIQIVASTDQSKLLIIDEEGKLKGKRVNVKATALYPYGSSDPIVGDVIFIPKENVD